MISGSWDFDSKSDVRKNSESQIFFSIFHLFVISLLKVHQNGALLQCLHCKHFYAMHHFGAWEKLIQLALHLKFPLPWSVKYNLLQRFCVDHSLSPSLQLWIIRPPDLLRNRLGQFPKLLTQLVLQNGPDSYSLTLFTSFFHPLPGPLSHRIQ